MVRTKESLKCGSKRLDKVPVASSPSSKKGATGGSGIRGNTLVQRETPQWQKPITQFFSQPSSSTKCSDPDKETENVSTETDKSHKEDVSSIIDKSPKKQNVSLQESVPLDDKSDDSD